MDLDAKYQVFQQLLRRLGRVVVAYSGGVDSTLLLKAAVDTLGPDNVLAVIGVSPSLARSQHEQAVDLARRIGARLVEAPIDELADGRYAANLPDRCLHCKTHLYQTLRQIADQQGLEHVVCGSNLDDLDDYRPGHEAAEAWGVQSPLVQASLTKADIRQLSRDMGLATADLPASPCLASRIVYGLEVTEERLRQVEEAEDFLRSLGLRGFRVRHHDTIARIEVQPEDLAKVIAEPLRSQIIDRLKSIGFRYVTADLQGFRSGSMNEAIPPEAHP